MKKLFSATKNFILNFFLSLKINFKGSFGNTTALVFIVIITALIPFGTSKVSANIIDSLIDSIRTGASSRNTIILYAILWALMDGFQSMMTAIRQYVYSAQSYKVKTFLEFKILTKYSEIDPGRYEQRDFQNLTQRAFGSRNYWPLQELGYNFIGSALWDIVEVIAASIIIGFFDWRIYVLIVVTTLPRFITDLFIGNKEWGIWTRDEGEEQRRYYNIREHLKNKTGRTELVFYQGYKNFLSRLKEIYDRTTTDLVKNEKKKLWLTVGVEAISTLGFGFAIYVVVTRVLGASLAVGQMTFIVASIGRLSGGVGDLLYNISRMYDSNRYVTDIRKFLDVKPLIQTPNPQEFKLFETPPVISFEHVSFNYPEQPTKILKDINLTIEPGQKIGLAGNNGAGKSTFIKLLCRIYDPSEGRITVNGIDLKNIKPEIWQSYLSVLMQDYASYEFTVKESIAISQPNAPYDHERMLWSAKAAQAYKFIEEWSGTYDEQLGVEFKGKEPSKGQNQKLALARTFYRKAPIMLLDEPTAAVDAESEIAIFKELDAMPKSITGIFISHDFSTIRRADRILVMETGVITEDGTHEQLVEKQGTYAHLFSEQVKSLVEDKTQA